MKVEKFQKYVSIPTKNNCGIKLVAKDVIMDYYPFHRHDFYEIEWIVRGSTRHEINGEIRTENVGTVFSMSPLDFHRYEFIDRPTIHIINIDYKNAPKAIQHILGKVEFPLVGHMSEELLCDVEFYFGELYKLMNETEGNFLSDRIIGYTLIILSKIFGCSESKTSVSSSSGYFHIRRAMEYIDKHYSSHLSLDSVATAVAVSSCHLSKLFRKTCGVSFVEYLTEYRVGKAQELLLESNKSVAEIADSCGFGSFSAFSRSFKQISGCSPIEYRKKSRI
ncbi:MAG: helix-turn-helix domain-containing protein [Clostridia bacterium]|nr:helix-turn-helix domain-containing protein [Clostridia bacterium]